MRVRPMGSCGLIRSAMPQAPSRWSVGFLGRLSAVRGQLRPWGEDLAEQSLSTLLYGSSWDDVGRDELVFLLPSLPRGACPDEPCGAAPSFHEALAEWTQRAARAADPSRSLGILSIIEVLHGAANGDVTEHPLSFREAMIGAVYTRINSAYAIPRLDHLHEPLMVAAWMGHLVAGRDAVLPPIIAAPLSALITAGISPASARNDPAAAVIVHYASAGGGVDDLARVVTEVCRTGRPRVVRSAMGDDPFGLDCALRAAAIATGV